MSDRAHARPSSTVVLARPGSGEPEIFMVLRHEQSSFGAAFAFPGGVVDPEDRDVHDFCAGISPRRANKNLGVPGDALDFYSAAIRELFEESGVLLGDLERVTESLATARDALNDGSDNWTDFVRRNRLELHCDALHYFAHWVTPRQQSKRYSTRFFLAALPPDQVAAHCGGELVESLWATAHDVLVAGREGRMTLHFPTIKTLESIARHKTIEALLDWASSCVQWGVTTLLPEIVTLGGRSEIVLPGDMNYPGNKS